MTTTLTGVNISPVNMENRKEIGIKPGDTVRVHQKIVDEKGKSRIQVFDGLVLARKHGTEPGATFTVRKVIDGIGVEKIFPLYSPTIDKIEIVRRSKVRRAKLYYIREKVMREIKRQMRRMHLMELATESEAEAAARIEDEARKAEAEAKAAEESDKVETVPDEASKEAETEVPVEQERQKEPNAEDKTSESKEGEQTEEEKKT